MLTKETTDTKQSDLKKKKWVKVSKKTKHKHKRSKSKISSALERSFNNEHDEHNTSVTSCSSASSENGLENFAMICITVNLVIISERTSSVSLILNNSSKMSTVIEKAINQFNMKFKEEKMLFKLKTEYERYALKPSKKKNGFPKTDMPSFNANSSLHDANVNSFTLIWKEDPYNYNVYFIDLRKSKKNCDAGKCNVF